MLALARAGEQLRDEVWVLFVVQGGDAQDGCGEGGTVGGKGCGVGWGLGACMRVGVVRFRVQLGVVLAQRRLRADDGRLCLWL